MIAPKPTTNEIKTYRAENQCSFYEARKAVLQQWRKRELYKLRRQAGEQYTVESLSAVVGELLDLLMEDADQ